MEKSAKTPGSQNGKRIFLLFLCVCHFYIFVPFPREAETGMLLLNHTRENRTTQKLTLDKCYYKHPILFQRWKHKIRSLSQFITSYILYEPIDFMV